MMKNKFTIMFILNHFFPEVGAIKTEFELSKNMANFGNNVYVLTTFPRPYRVPDRYKNYFDKLFHKRVSSFEKIGKLLIYRVKTFISRADKISHRLLEIIISIPILSLYSLLMTAFLKPDIIIVGGDVEPLVSIIAYPSKFFARKKILVILHDIASQSLLSVGIVNQKGMIYRLIRFLEKVMFTLVDKIVVHSPSNKNLVVKLGAHPSKVENVYIWADLTKVKPLSMAEKRKYCKRRNKDIFLVYYGGVLSYPQGPDIIADVARIVKEKGAKNIRFLIVGEGPEKEKILAKIMKNGLNNIELLPFQPWETHIKLLQCSDAALVLLRKNYKQPVVPSKLIEIMATGTIPVLSLPYESDARRIIMKYKGAGIWVPPSEPERLADAIINLSKLGKNELAKLCNNARKVAEKLFDVNKSTQLYLNIIEKMLAHD